MTGRVALVTGGAGGIGRAIVKALRDAGIRAVVMSRRAVGPDTAPGDVSHEADVTVAEVLRVYGRLDILVNAAGVSDPAAWTADLEAVTPELWDRVLKTDLWGTFACSRAAARAMKDGGAIVNVGSIPALVGDRDGLVYSVAKAAVIGLTKSLAVSLAPRIRVNCLAFGSIATDWTQWLDPAKTREYTDAIPLRRFGRPEEAGEMALLLATNTYMTGQTVVLDGGETRL